MPVPGQALADHLAGEHVQRREQRRGAVALVVMGHRRRPALDHRQRRLGAVQRLHRGFLVQAQHDRVVRRARYSPTTSISFSSNRGSLDSLNVLTRCGLSPRAAQTRCTVAGDTPTWAAIVRHDQCVCPAGVECRVSSTISSILACGMLDLRPRPGPDLAQLGQPVLGEPAPATRAPSRPSPRPAQRSARSRPPRRPATTPAPAAPADAARSATSRAPPAPRVDRRT